MLRQAVRHAIQPNRELSEAEFRARRALDGYDDPEVIRFRVARAELHRGDVGYLSKGSPGFLALLAAASMASPAKVLDFGGGFGHVGQMLKAVMPSGSVATYTVVELPSFAVCAQAAGFNGYANDPSSVDANIIFVSGTLQYLPTPLTTLGELLSLGAAYVVLARNFFSATSPRYFEQRSALFDHGAGPMPPGFTNRQTLLHPQALAFEQVQGLITQHHDIIVRTPNSDGVAYSADGLFGEDLICRRRG